MSNSHFQLTRRPPANVRRELCNEVGFRCPVDDCGLPYLTFHHFDPPWRVENHHNASGMIALCSNHAAKADQGYYPDDYFRRLKADGSGRAKSVQGQFDYLRRDLMVVVGSNAFYNVDTMLQIDGRRAVFFKRDADGYLLLNFQVPGVDGHPRAWMEDNVWLVPPGAENIDCPPRGRYLDVRFDNGDRFRIEFTEFPDPQSFLGTYPYFHSLLDQVEFPLAVAEFWEKAEGAGVELGRGVTNAGGLGLSQSIIRNVQLGISVRDGWVGIGSGSRPPGFSWSNQQAIAAALRTTDRGRA